MKTIPVTMLALFLLASIAHAAPTGEEPGLGHYCNIHTWSPWWHECNLGNASCVAATPHDWASCPPGSDPGSGECVTGYQVRPCTSTERSLLGFNNTCHLGIQDCDDGARIVWPIETNSGLSVKVNENAIKVYLWGVLAGQISCKNRNE